VSIIRLSKHSLYKTHLHDFLSGKQHVRFHERDGVSQDIHVFGQEVKKTREKPSQPRFIGHRQRGHSSNGHLPPAQSKRSAHEHSLTDRMTNRTIPSSSKCSFAGPVRLSSISGTISGSIVNVEALAAYHQIIWRISLIQFEHLVTHTATSFEAISTKEALNSHSPSRSAAADPKSQE